MKMIPDIQSCIICEDVRREINGKLMLIGVTANMILPKLPCKIDKLHIVTSLCCGEGEFELSTKIYAPGQKTVVLKNEKPNKIILKDTNTLATVVQCFINPTFNEKGIYWVETLIDNNLKLRFPLPITTKDDILQQKQNHQ